MKKKKFIVFVGGGVQEVNILKYLKRKYKIILLDRNKECACKKYSDLFINVSATNLYSIKKNISKILKKRPLIALTFSELEMATTVINNAIFLENRIGLKKVFNFKNKLMSKKNFNMYKVRTPEFIYSKKISEINKFCKKYNYRCFTKPIIGFGGIGAKKLLGKQNIKKFFDGNKKKCLVEKFINGRMIDVNGFFDLNGDFHCLGIFERNFDKNFPSEVFAVYPANISPKLYNEASKITELSLRSLGINFGPVKSDLILNKGKFFVLEVANRLHGPKSFELYSLSNGSNHLDIILNSISNNKLINTKPTNKVACFNIRPKRKNMKKITLKNKNFFTKYYNKFEFKENYLNNTDIIGSIFIAGSNLKEIKNKMIKYKNYIY